MLVVFAAIAPSSTKSEVSQHIHIESPGHSVDLKKVKLLDKDDRWFERGVKEAIYIRAYKPSLNKDGGRYRLPRVYDPLLTSLPPTSVNTSRQIQPASADERWCNSPENSRYLYFLWVDQEFKFSIYLQNLIQVGFVLLFGAFLWGFVNIVINCVWVHHSEHLRNISSQRPFLFSDSKVNSQTILNFNPI